MRAGGHSVDAEVVKRRYKRGIMNFFGLYRSIGNTWAVYDNSVSGEPILIAEQSKNKGADKIHRQDLWTRFCHTNK